MKEIIEDARIEDRNHFEALVPRIYELGGKLPDDIRTLADRAGCPDAYLPDTLGGVPDERKGSGKTALGSYPGTLIPRAGRLPVPRAIHGIGESKFLSCSRPPVCP